MKLNPNDQALFDAGRLLLIVSDHGTTMRIELGPNEKAEATSFLEPVAAMIRDIAKLTGDNPIDLLVQLAAPFGAVGAVGLRPEPRLPDDLPDEIDNLLRGIFGARGLGFDNVDVQVIDLMGSAGGKVNAKEALLQQALTELFGDGERAALATQEFDKMKASRCSNPECPVHREGGLLDQIEAKVVARGVARPRGQVAN